MATYTVKAGDSLSKIARDVLGAMNRWPELARLNGMTAPYTIFPGQVLQLPPGGAPAAVAVPEGVVPYAPPVPAPSAAPGAPARPGFDLAGFLRRYWLPLSLAGVGAALLLTTARGSSNRQRREL